METDAKRAERRKAEAKRKAKALEQLRPQLEAKHLPLHPVDVPKEIGKMAHTRTRCSCPMCGNFRKYGKGEGKLTLAECKARLKEKE